MIMINLQSVSTTNVTREMSVSMANGDCACTHHEIGP